MTQRFSYTIPVTPEGHIDTSIPLFSGPPVKIDKINWSTSDDSFVLESSEMNLVFVHGVMQSINFI